MTDSIKKKRVSVPKQGLPVSRTKAPKPNVVTDGFSTRAPRTLDAPPAPPAPATRNPVLETEVARRRSQAGGPSSTATSPRFGPNTVQVGTYNLGRGNTQPNARNDGARFHVDESARLLAREVMKPQRGLDVVMLEEFSAIRGDTENPADSPDYSMLTLGAVFRESLGPDWNGASLSWESVAASGQVTAYSPDEHSATRVTATLPDGRTQTIDIQSERLDATGAAFDGEGRPPVNVNTMTLPDGRSYALVFGASDAGDGSNFGNALLLGPNAPITRRADGSVDPRSIEVLTLGTDPDGEVRTALSVNVSLPEGRDARFVATHFSNGVSTEATDARRAQYDVLYRYTQSLGDQEVVVGGDFNSNPNPPLGSMLPGVLFPPRYPLPAQGGLVSTDATLAGIDHVLTSANVETSGPTRAVEGGGSDHLLVETEVKIR